MFREKGDHVAESSDIVALKKRHGVPLREWILRYVFLTGICYEGHETACPTDGSSYLGFNYFKPIDLSAVRSYWNTTTNLIKEKKAPPQLALYVHWPFCVSHCTFCFCNVRIPENAQEMKLYAAMLKREAEALQDLFSETPFASAYFGGGTASFIPERDLDDLMEYLVSRLKWVPNPGMSFDSALSTLTREKVQILKRHGVNHIVLGIQSMDADVLSGINRRGQTAETVKRAHLWLTEAGVRVGWDLLYGMPGQSEKSFLRDFSLAAQMGPNDIRVNFFDPRAHTPFVRSGGNVPAEHWRWAVRVAPYMDKLATNFGYSIASNDPASDDFCPPIVLTGQNSMRFRSSVLGLGSGAISHAFGAAWYQHPPVNQWFDIEKQGLLPFSSMPFNLEWEMRTHLVRILGHFGTINRKYFRGIFGCDPLDNYGIAQDIRDLESLGKLRVTEADIFFISRNRMNLLIYSKHLYPPELVEKIISTHRPEFKRFIKNKADGTNGISLIEHKYIANVWRLYTRDKANTKLFASRPDTLEN